MQFAVNSDDYRTKMENVIDIDLCPQRIQETDETGDKNGKRNKAKENMKVNESKIFLLRK